MSSNTNSSSNTIGLLSGSAAQKMSALSGYISCTDTGVLTKTYSSASAITGNLTIRDSLDPNTMQIDIPLVVQGRDVMKELDELRDSVLLLKRHVDMEAKYPKLKELKDAYESQLAKYKTFDAIKESK